MQWLDTNSQFVTETGQAWTGVRASSSRLQHPSSMVPVMSLPSSLPDTTDQRPRSTPAHITNQKRDPKLKLEGFFRSCMISPSSAAAFNSFSSSTDSTSMVVEAAVLVSLLIGNAFMETSHQVPKHDHECVYGFVRA
jgi:hypothetical protein